MTGGFQPIFKLEKCFICVLMLWFLEGSFLLLLYFFVIVVDFVVVVFVVVCFVFFSFSMLLCSDSY